MWHREHGDESADKRPADSSVSPTQVRPVLRCHDLFRLWDYSALFEKHHIVINCFTPVDSGWEEADQKSAKSNKAEGMAVQFFQTQVCRATLQTSVKLKGAWTGSTLYFVFLTLCSLSPHNPFFIYLQSIEDDVEGDCGFFPSNDAVFRGMTILSTNLAQVTRGTITSPTALTSTGRIISSINFITWHRGTGSERRSGTSRERAPMEVHLQNKTIVSLCLFEHLLNIHIRCTLYSQKNV